jgi:hypothetical protein
LTLVLDAGAFVAIERGSSAVVNLLRAETRLGRVPLTHGGVVGQVWRGSARQVSVARLLPLVRVAPLDDALGRRAGRLLGQSKRKDVVDAALVLLAEDGDVILTSDIDDLKPLAMYAGIDVDFVNV